VQIKGKVRDRIEVPSDIDEATLRERALALPKVLAATEGGIRTVIVKAPKLVNIVPA
jgi:leucyl-tRNA synthetase